jgi:hypothetical protein
MWHLETKEKDNDRSILLTPKAVTITGNITQDQGKKQDRREEYGNQEREEERHLEGKPEEWAWF